MNPKRRRRSNRRRSYRRRRSNPVTRRRFYGHRRRRHSYRSNPRGYHRRRRSYSRRRRHNPAGLTGGIGSYVTFSLWAIAGMLGSRAIPEALLGGKNTGLLGYGANVATALAGGPILGKILRNRRAGAAFTVGGILATVARAITEYTPFGAQVKQAFALQGVGDWGISGLGEYIANPYAQPLQMQNTDWPAMVPSSSFVRAGMPALPAPAMSGLGLAADKIYSGSSIWS